MEYDARQKAILDHNQMVLEATEKGLKQGIEKSIEIVVKKLIAAGYPTDTIAQLTDISSNIIEKMRTDTE